MLPVTAIEAALHYKENRPGVDRKISTRPQRKPRGLECGDTRHAMQRTSPM